MNIKDSTNLIVNGTFDSNDLNGWIGAGTTASPSAYDGHASLPTGGSISQTVTITGGETYALSYYMGLLYQATGDITVISNPSGTQLFTDSTAGTQSSIFLTVTEPTDTTLTIKFTCQIGGELDVDNVSLVAVATEQAVVVGGDFSDSTLPGWVQNGTSSGTKPSVTDGYLKLPAGTSVYQDIVVEEGKQLEITCSMTLPDGAAGEFSVASRPSYSSHTSTSLYSSSTELSGQSIFCSPPEGDTIVRLTFSSSSGEVHVDDVVMGYASSTLITEVLTGNHAPWIAPGASGLVTFSVQDNAPAEPGAYIQFAAPKGTTLVDASVPGLTASFYTFTLSDDSLTGNLTLNKNSGSWISCQLTLAVDGDTAAGTSLSGGTAKCFNSDGQQIGDAAAISVIAATVTITVQEVPLIFPGTSGTLSVGVVADSPDGTGSYLYFTAPTYTDPDTSAVYYNATIIDVTLSDTTLADKYTFTSEKNGQNARLTLVQDGVLWSDCIVTLAVDSSMPKFATLDNGTVQYMSSDDQPVGDAASITVTAASSNHWDNVASVESCIIGMQSDDISFVNKGTLFMNGQNNTDGVFSAHSIPVFVGITFKLLNDDLDGPTDDEIRAALSLVGLASDGKTIIDISSNFDFTTDTKYRNAYYKATTLSPEHELTLEAGGYEHELNFGAWCPKYHTDVLPGDLVVYLHLEAPLSGGTYKYTSNGETPANLTVNFIAQKKYQYSEDNGNSQYILVNKSSVPGSIEFYGNGEMRDAHDAREESIYRIVIDSTPDQSKYIFKLVELIWIHFSYPKPDSHYEEYGKIYSAYIKAYKVGPQWSNYGQHILLPDYSCTDPRSLTESSHLESSYVIGPVGTHEAHGWACCGTLKVTGDGITINPGEIAFAAVSIDFESTTDDSVWNANNTQDSSGNSPICAVDNFGNYIYLVPKFGAEEGSTKMSVTVEDS